MPCDCSHLEPTQRESESKTVAELIVYLFHSLDKPVPPTVYAAATDTYGDAGRADEFTALLCDKLKRLTNAQLAKWVYNGRSPAARKLADWWDEHQKIDAEKERDAKELKDLEAVKKKALAKLTPDERRALGHR